MDLYHTIHSARDRSLAFRHTVDGTDEWLSKRESLGEYGSWCERRRGMLTVTQVEGSTIEGCPAGVVG